MRIALLLVLLVLLAVAALVALATRMPGRKPPPAAATAAHLATAEVLRHDVLALAGHGERNVFVSGSLERASTHITIALRTAGLTPERHEYDARGIHGVNIVAEVKGSSSEAVVVVGAHYDSVIDAPGADDNASGVAVLLELARRLAKAKPQRTVRFVAFANEEPPHFQSASMGSWQYARACRAHGDRIHSMLSLESLGYFDSHAGSQRYPPPLAALYPSRGDFVAFVGNVRSLGLVRRCVRTFRNERLMPAEGAALPELIPQAGWSDQWSFWKTGVPAVMVTDTAVFRNPHYHTPGDLPETLDYVRMAQVTDSLEAVVRDLVGADSR